MRFSVICKRVVLLYRGATGREDVLTERNAHLHVSNLRCGKVK